MKLLSIQMALFAEEPIVRPDLLFNEVNENMDGIIDDMPTVLNLPNGAPIDIPIVQAKSANGHFNINVSRFRIDLIIHFDFKNDLSPLENLNSQKNRIQKFYKGVLHSINANRTGLVLSIFAPKADNVKAVFGKYFSEKYTSRYVEASMRINKQNMRKSFTYNNIRSVESATVTVGSNNITGVLFQYDINNVTEQGKRINEDVVSYVLSRGVEVLSPESVKEMI